MKKTLSLLIILAFSSYCHAQKEKIELNLVKGETYKLKMMADMAMVQNMNGQGHTIKVGISGKINYKVVVVLNTAYEIKVKYESLRMKMDITSGVLAFDSEKENSDDMFSKI